MERWRGGGARRRLSSHRRRQDCSRSAALGRNAGSNSPILRLVVVVPSLALLDQWVVALETELGPIAWSNRPLLGRKQVSQHPGQANVVVINTARAVADDGSSVAGATFWSWTNATGPVLLRTLEPCRFPLPCTLGLSATPVREFDDGFERYVEPALGPVIFEYDYVDAKRDGILSDFALHHFRVPLTTPRRFNPERAQVDGAVLGSRSTRHVAPLQPSRSSKAMPVPRSYFTSV